jgi:hypothetical protein
MKEMYLLNIPPMSDMNKRTPNKMDIFFNDLKNKGSEYSAQVLSMSELLGQPRGNASSVIRGIKDRSSSVLKKAA